MNKEILQKFIVIEGIDGAGTTTQNRLLSEWLTVKGVGHCKTFEPTEEPSGKAIRALLAGYAAAPGTLAWLFAADRYNHLHMPDGGVLAQLQLGKWVISDRYLFSSLAYQSMDYPFEKVAELNSSFPLPELLFFLDIPAEVGEERLAGRSALEIFETTDKQRVIRDSYMRVLNMYKDTNMQVVIIDGTQPAEVIAKAIQKRVSQLLEATR